MCCPTAISLQEQQRDGQAVIFQQGGKGEKDPDLAHRPNALRPSNVAFTCQLIWQMAAYGRAELGSKNDTLNSSHLSSSKLWISSKNNEKVSRQERIKDYSLGSE
ncbi:hypothetical protein B0H14DRAFT_2629811 [Mycena olivaceomarginata]|nr:hypothetical protein B0H14DRAFT_2629811 [Mycena olivaceomarginata]